MRQPARNQNDGAWACEAFASSPFLDVFTTRNLLKFAMDQWHPDQREQSKNNEGQRHQMESNLYKFCTAKGQ